ncbi:F-box only protein 9 [Anopheles stephensi]|uniref:F-box only protein 9 n=1 Tax=Anopheles stephensi TaxID=30069 RepID=UPI0007D641CC|nr:F-box only protein 9 [Anopheles stephensi]XP_035917258.1 F-box only protein 9 [Anopheles stephensi]
MDSTSSDAGKEDDDDSSSSSTSGSDAITPKRSELDDFRERWQQELKREQPVANAPAVATHATTVETDSVEHQARALFQQGSDLERSGKVFEAMRLYRRATQLVPDIEFRVYDKKHAKPKEDVTNDERLVEGLMERMMEANIDEDEENLENVDLVLRFQTLMARSGKLFERATGDRKLIVTSAHFSDLPMELILYILRWVVSNDLDMKSLERFASVCRGFYLLARDPEIWRHACMRIWGVNLGVLKGTPFSSWREMYISRPRILFHGCYISRTSYLRSGENSFQDQFYRPIQLVEYYRYFRFFADGKVLMLTTADEPQQCVVKLKPRCPTQNEILRGHYRLHDDVVIVAIQRNRPTASNAQMSGRPSRKVREIEPEYGQQTFLMELQIVSTAKRPFSQLHWKQYTMVQQRNNQEKTTQFELTSTKYPPLYFSRVKSYHQESDGPLK